MDSEPQAQTPESAQNEAATAARRLVRTALKASLATLDRETGHPYPSLVLVATEPDGSPILLLSGLAQHTRNLVADGRAAILRFVARHASAQGYAAFPDFAAYALSMAKGHFIGGFGRIVSLDAAALMTPVDGAAELIRAEPDIIEHMNADHADAVALYATQLAGCEPGEWRMVGIDPAGCDLLHRTNVVRIEFAEPVHSPTQARVALVALAKEARSRTGQAA
jgi:putative heme iron utilization protein